MRVKRSAWVTVLIVLGQQPPGTTPEIYVPGIVSTRADEHGLERSFQKP